MALVTLVYELVFIRKPPIPLRERVGPAPLLYISGGSLSELGTYIEIARRLGYVQRGPIATVEQKLMDVDKIITGLIQSLVTL